MGLQEGGTGAVSVGGGPGHGGGTGRGGSASVATLGGYDTGVDVGLQVDEEAPVIVAIIPPVYTVPSAVVDDYTEVELEWEVGEDVKSERGAVTRTHT